MVLEKFCCCLNLEDGAALWGIISTVTYFWIYKQYKEVTSVLDQIGSLGAIGHLTPQLSAATDEINSTLSKIDMYFATAIISSILLTIGALKRNHLLMLPWLIISLVPLIFLLPFTIIAVPILFPYYIWWCVHSARKKVLNQKMTTIQHAHSVVTVGQLGNGLLPTYAVPIMPPTGPNTASAPYFEPNLLYPNTEDDSANLSDYNQLGYSKPPPYPAKQ